VTLATPHPLHRALRVVALATLLTLGGCTPFKTGLPGQPMPGQPAPTPGGAPDLGQQIANAAEALLGSPYRYGGAGPDAFDCSGLVSFVHAKFGVHAPRTAAQQFAAVRAVPRANLHAGDLVFFRLSGGSVSHVGVYIGDGYFVHAPQTGTNVRIASLDDDFFRPRYAGGGRLYGR
jgi:cell wall-associated NlpC family hydrolase